MNKLRVFLALAAIAACGGAAAQSSSLVPLKGTVSAQPESVAFSGQAKITSRLAKDPDFGSPHLLLTIDLTGVAGTGSSSRAKYVISGPELVQRRLAASQRVEITFPFAKTDGTATPQSGVAAFLLDFDLATGAVTGASGSIATPNFPR